MNNAFARDADGKIKTKQGCQTPGCNFPNYHVCLVGKPDTFPELLGLKKNQRKIGLDQAHRDAIAATQRERWARIHEESSKRDETIIKLYNEEDLGMNAIAKRTGYAQSTVNKVINRAAKEGLVVVRPRGVTRARPGT
jgi:DNA-directed RNA polymerase specialized sigma24 family protein